MTDKKPENSKQKKKEAFRAKFDEKIKSFAFSSPTTFAELTASTEAWRLVDKVFDTLWDFEILAENLIYQADSSSDIISGIKTLAREMVDVVDDLGTVGEAKAEETSLMEKVSSFFNKKQGSGRELPDLGEVYKAKGHASLLKSTDGQDYFYGRFTNNIYDRENEVLTTESHENFAKFLDENPEKAPELWDWHEEWTAKSHQAVWWDYADGFFHAIWPVTEREAKGIAAFMDEFDPGMSHGFKVITRDPENPNQITGYETFEASILPLEYAANQWTTFNMLPTQLKESENKEKMFTNEKLRALELLNLGDVPDELQRSSEAEKTRLDQLNVERKENKMQENEEPTVVVEEEEEGTEEQPQTAPVKENDPSDRITSLEATIVQGFELLQEKMQELEGQAKTLKLEVENRLDAVEGSMTEIKETRGESPTVAAWLAKNNAKSAIPTSTAHPKNKSGDQRESDEQPLFGSPETGDLFGPKEAPWENGGHLLGNL